MGPAVVVIGEVIPQEAPEVRLPQDEDVIQTLAADRADQALDVRVLPGRPRRRDDLLNPQALDRLPEAISVNAIPVADQVAGGFAEGESLAQLLGDPGGRRPRRDVVV